MKIDCKLRIEYRASARANSRMREKASLIIEKDPDRKWRVYSINLILYGVGISLRAWDKLSCESRGFNCWLLNTNSLW